MVMYDAISPQIFQISLRVQNYVNKKNNIQLPKWQKHEKPQ